MSSRSARVSTRPTIPVFRLGNCSISSTTGSSPTGAPKDPRAAASSEIWREAVPRPDAAGRTYVFRLRPGVRFSDGREVRPSDVRASLERLFQVDTSGAVAPFYGEILGAGKCVPGHACDLSRGIVGGNRGDTVTFHLTAPDPDFLYKLALPPAFVVPAGSPMTIAHRPLPGTGPYRVDGSLQPHRLVLSRNPRFQLFAPGATPDGFPDRIVATTDVPPRSRVAAIRTHAADVATGLLDLPGERRQATHGQVSVAAALGPGRRDGIPLPQHACSAVLQSRRTSSREPSSRPRHGSFSCWAAGPPRKRRARSCRSVSPGIDRTARMVCDPPRPGLPRPPTSKRPHRSLQPPGPPAREFRSGLPRIMPPLPDTSRRSCGGSATAPRRMSSPGTQAGITT